MGFRPATELVTKKAYESQLLVHTEFDLGKPWEKLQPWVKLVAELSNDPTEQISGLYISGDSAQLSTFTFERRGGVPFSENKYFSRATLSTANHIRALEKLEKILS